MTESQTGDGRASSVSSTQEQHEWRRRITGEAVSSRRANAPGGDVNRLQLRHILCPMDLSPLYMNSLEWANGIARARRAELRALHVVVTEGIVAPDSLGSLERSDIMMKLREAPIATDPENAHTGAAIRQGDPGTQILKFARSLPADLVVMGAAGAERPARPMGSLTATVVGRCDCPVLIVPRGRRIHGLESGVFKEILCAVGLAPSSVGVIRQALARMGNSWTTRHVRVRDDRTQSVSNRDSD